jgi:uncharacterized protein (DUF1697 family)
MILRANTDCCVKLSRDKPVGPESRQVLNVTFDRNHGDPVTGMALIVFLRGVNVGGHRTFRPSILARELSDYDVVNVGAAGTFIVRRPGSRGEFRAALLRKLPFEAEVVLCEGRNLIRLETENPFGSEPSGPDIVRFVSILSRAGGLRTTLPVIFPRDGEWLVRVIASNKQFVFGMYRRHMKTISYLGQIDKLFGVPATTRNWNTILAVLRLLKDGEKKATNSPRTT